MVRLARGASLTALALLVMGPIAPAGAQEEPGSTQVTSLSASADGGTLSVAGVADFAGQAPQVMATDEPGDGPIRPELTPVHQATGVDLLGGTIHQPDPDVPTLIFTWQVVSLPESGSVPEGVRYTFPFVIGEKSFQPQAKLTNLASATLLDDPAGHARAPGDFFQLRGNCVTNYPVPQSPLANCPHVAWLTGEFDTATDTVLMEIPIGAEFAPEIVPGALLEPTVVAGTTITASYQAVVSNSTVSDSALWDGATTYTVPSKDVGLGVAPVGTDPAEVSFAGQATVAEDNAFAADVDVSDLAAGDYELFARACFAGNCGVASAPFTVA